MLPRVLPRVARDAVASAASPGARRVSEQSQRAATCARHWRNRVLRKTGHQPLAWPSSTAPALRPRRIPCSPSREGPQSRKRKNNQLEGTCKEGEIECKASRKLSPCRRSRTKVLTPLTHSFTSFTIITARTSNLLYAQGEVCYALALLTNNVRRNVRRRYPGRRHTASASRGLHTAPQCTVERARGRLDQRRRDGPDAAVIVVGPHACARLQPTLRLRERARPAFEACSCERGQLERSGEAGDSREKRSRAWDGGAQS